MESQQSSQDDGRATLRFDHTQQPALISVHALPWQVVLRTGGTRGRGVDSKAIRIYQLARLE